MYIFMNVCVGGFLFNIQKASGNTGTSLGMFFKQTWNYSTVITLDCLVELPFASKYVSPLFAVDYIQDI